MNVEPVELSRVCQKHWTAPQLTIALVNPKSWCAYCCNSKHCVFSTLVMESRVAMDLGPNTLFRSVQLRQLNNTSGAASTSKSWANPPAKSTTTYHQPLLVESGYCNFGFNWCSMFKVANHHRLISEKTLNTDF